ncbi:hypothetical protein DFH28DRAFT_970769 [Melampsora americana]|nr:hypothetical protein DFH28DRAFT_970769 [Melampsora americana]
MTCKRSSLLSLICGFGSCSSLHPSSRSILYEALSPIATRNILIEMLVANLNIFNLPPFVLPTPIIMTQINQLSQR